MISCYPLFLFHSQSYTCSLCLHSGVDFSLSLSLRFLLNMSKTQRDWVTFPSLISWLLLAALFSETPLMIYDDIVLFLAYCTLWIEIHNLVVYYYIGLKLCKWPDCREMLSHHFNHKNIFIPYLWTQSFYSELYHHCQERLFWIKLH